MYDKTIHNTEKNIVYDVILTIETKDSNDLVCASNKNLNQYSYHTKTESILISELLNIPGLLPTDYIHFDVSNGFDGDPGSVNYIEIRRYRKETDEEFAIRRNYSISIQHQNSLKKELEDKALYEKLKQRFDP